MAVKRGDVIPVAAPGDYGKPRPALVIQSDLFDEHPSVTLLPLTSELRETPLFRILIEPTPETGLRKPSQVMVDKLLTVPRAKAGEVIGRLDDQQVLAVNRAVLVFLGLA